MKLTWARMKEQNKSVVELIRKVLRGQGTVEEEWFTSFGCTGNFVQAVALAMVAETQEGQRISGAENAVLGDGLKEECNKNLQQTHLLIRRVREAGGAVRKMFPVGVAGEDLPGCDFEVKFPGKTTQSSDSVPAMAAAELRAESDVDWNLFHKLWTAAVGTPGYEKELWIQLEGVLAELKRQRWVCAHCRTVIGKDQSHRPIRSEGNRTPTCAVFHNDFIAVPGEGVGPVAKKFHAQKFTEVPLVSVRTVATAFEIEPLATVTVAGGVGHSDLDIPGDFVRQLLGRLADVLVGHGFTANSLYSVESVGSPLSDGNTILITLKVKDGQ